GALIVFFTAYFLFGFAVSDKTTLYAAAIAAAFSVTTLPFELRKNKPERKDFSYLLPRFYYAKAEEAAKFFLPYLCDYQAVERIGSVLRAQKYDVKFYLKPDALSANAAIAFALPVKRKTLLVASNVAPTAREHAAKANANLKIIDFNRFCAVIDARCALPKDDKPGFFKRAHSFFDKALRAENGTRLISAGGVMLALSFANGFSVWYLCFSAFFAALSIVAFVRGKSEAGPA
ncbi:MAG: hypothetical protein ACI4SC_06520, partial [Candidatus Neoclostridium sp.]